MTDRESVGLRCSTWTRSQQVDPVGTAGCYRGFLLVDVPLPWPRDVAMMEQLEPARKAVEGLGFRIQATVPDRGSGRDRTGITGRRVVLHSPSPDQVDGWFGGYVRYEATAGAGLEAAIADLLTGPSTESGQRDLLVCTHGRRDVCCGSAGTELHASLARSDGFGPGVALRRTSHTGGHRFAPTFILLPEGSIWAYADTRLVERVLRRSVPFAEVAAHYRGCSGLGSGPVQALERAVLAETGWELLDHSRRGFATGEAAGGGTIHRLETGTGSWEAVVGPGRTLAVPDCMRPISEARKSETEWVVSGLRPL